MGIIESRSKDGVGVVIPDKDVASRKLCTVYSVSCERCSVVLENSTVKRDLQVRWVENRFYSEDVRKEILAEISDRIQAVNFSRRRIEISVAAVVPCEHAGETSIQLFKPLPAARAKAVLRRKFSGSEELDACFAFEKALDQHLDRLGVGFVDGNDVGGGEYRIFCFGPLKRALLEAIELAMPVNDGWSVT